jgi:hypothetical protein
MTMMTIQSQVGTLILSLGARRLYCAQTRTCNGCGPRHGRHLFGGLESEYRGAEVETSNVTLTLESRGTGVAFKPNEAGFAPRVPDVEEARKEIEARGVEFLGRHLRLKRLSHGLLRDPSQALSTEGAPHRALAGPGWPPERRDAPASADVVQADQPFRRRPARAPRSAAREFGIVPANLLDEAFGIASDPAPLSSAGGTHAKRPPPSRGAWDVSTIRPSERR